MIFVSVDITREKTSASSLPQFTIEKLDSTSVLIEGIMPSETLATFDDSFDIFSKKDIINNDDDNEWTKVRHAHVQAFVENKKTTRIEWIDIVRE
jgi:hypothetical protein